MDSVRGRGLASGLFILCMTLVLSACPPEVDSIIPLQTVVIKKIPLEICRTEVADTSNTKHPTFRVYIQLSDGFTAKAKGIALGYATLGDPKSRLVEENGTYTAIITNLEGDEWDGKTWATVAVIISPEFVEDIYDIDFKAGYGGSSTTGTVNMSWKEKLLSKHAMVMFSGAKAGMENLRRLYGEKGATDGTIVNDDGIKGEKERADPEVINNINLFNRKND